MSINRAVCLLCCLLCSGAGVLSAADIIVNGRSVQKGILLPANANEVEQVAAQELQYHLQEATGAQLPIVNEGSAEAAALNGGYALGAVEKGKGLIDLTGMPPCAYKVRYQDGFLYIRGQDDQGEESVPNTAAGTLFGTTDYLMKSLGARWVLPGKDGEFIPRLTKVTVGSEQECDFKPALRYQGARTYHPLRSPGGKEKFRWARRTLHYYTGGANKYAGSRSGHAFEKWHETYAEKHPEWFSLIRGKRKTTPSYNMCVSNSDFQDEVVRLWWEIQKENPGRKLLINVKENDNQNRCQCPECVAWDGDDVRGPTGRYAISRNVGERYAHFYRAVQEKAAKFDPEAMVGFYAYQTYFFAPRNITLNPGCYSDLVPDIPFPRTKEHTEWLRNEYQAWKATGASFGLRPNYFLGGYCMPEIWHDEYIDEFKYLLSELNIQGLDVDGPSGMFGTQSLNLYAMARITVEPTLTAADIEREYLEGFGAGAPWVKEYTDYYYRYMKENAERINTIYQTSTKRRWYFHGFEYGDYAFKIFPPESLEKGLEIIGRGLTALTNSADKSAVAKLDFLRLGLEHALLTVRCGEVVMAAGGEVSAKRQAIEQLQEYRKQLPVHLTRSANLERAERKWESMLTVEMQKPDKAREIIALPEKWAMQLDPKDIGEKAGYMRPDFDATAWKPASTWKTLEEQGHVDYINAWYRFSFKLGEGKKNFKVSLFLGAVDESCKIWVNGKLAGELIYDAVRDPRSWEKPFEIDITKFVDFKADNEVVVKLNNVSGAGGIWKPSFIALR